MVVADADRTYRRKPRSITNQGFSVISPPANAATVLTFAPNGSAGVGRLWLGLSQVLEGRQRSVLP